MNLNDVLQSLGLSEAESRVYLSLLLLRQANISDLAKESGLYRPAVYRTLPKLTALNLAVVSKVGKRTMYTAGNPVNLENLVQTLADKIADNIPKLAQMYESSTDRPNIRVYHGKKSIRLLYTEIIQSISNNSAIYRYESPKDYRRNASFYSKNYWSMAAGPYADIDKYVITNEATHNKRTKRLNRHSKPVPESYDLFNYDITQLIYNDSVVFIDFEAETATVIEGKRFAEFQTRLFKLLFKKL